MLAFSLTASAVERMTRDTFEAEVRRFAQRYASTMTDLSAQIHSRPISNEQKHRITVYQVESVASAVSIAIGENPVTNLLDMMALASLTRIRFEAGVQLEDKQFGELLASTARELEAIAWALSGSVLTQQQQDEVRRLIDEWATANPDGLFVWPTRFSSYSGLRGTGLDEVQRTGGLLRQYSRAVNVAHEARELGERLLFYIQYAPYIATMQADQIMHGLLASPEIDKSLAAVTNLLPTIEAASALAREINETSKTLERTASAINLDLGTQAGEPVDVAAYQSLLEESAVAMAEMRQLVGALERLAESQPAVQEIPRVLAGLREAIDSILMRVFMLVIATIIAFFVALYIYQRAAHAFRISRDARP